jgi:acetylornithine deacetylase/succinyl-diaminopimelate desuccinylase-like protein
MKLPLPTDAIDWSEVTEQATDLLREYIRIDTTNPPGGEEAGADLLRRELAREGFESRYHDAGDGRVSISARLSATEGAAGKPIVLLSHIDVVPAEPVHWRVDPFSGDLVDDVIWGRGALDMKGMGIMELMVLALARRHRLPLKNDIVFLAVADEEEGGHRGVRFLQESAPELFDASLVINEGAYGFSNFFGQDVTMFGVCPSEKSPCWLTLRAAGAPGHASVPHADNAVARLVRALARIEKHEQRTRITEPVHAMFRTLTARGLVPSEIDLEDLETVEAIAAADAHVSAITRDTVNLTGLTAGQKHNVIPAGAEATLDCRLLPDTDPDRFVAELRELIDDPRIEVTRVLEHVSGQSSLDTPFAKTVGEVVAERYGEQGHVVPMLSPGFTDSHAFRAAGVDAYGFTPALLTREELATIHGHNERISRANLRLGTEVLFDVVGRLACRGC